MPTRLLPPLLVLPLLLASCGGSVTETPSPVTVVYEKAGSACGDELVQTSADVADDDSREEAALVLLLLGPEEERADVQATVYQPEAIQAVYPGKEDLDALIDYYEGMTIQDGVATIDFEEDALAYLNGTACMQGSVKKPIEATLTSFPTIREVRYSIDGEVFDQWDA